MRGGGGGGAEVDERLMDLGGRGIGGLMRGMGGNERGHS